MTASDLKEVWKHYADTTDSAHGVKHVKEVLRIIKGLAEKNGIDKKKAEMAAILHDIGREVERRMPSVDHAEAGADIAKHFTKDKSVLNAIRRHRKGSGEKPRTMLDKILWDADLVAGLNHAEERCYQWNRDAGLSPEKAKKESLRFLREVEVKTYEPSNAFTQEAKEMLEKKLPELKEKLASLKEENDRLMNELRVKEVRLPAIPSITSVAVRVPNHSGIGATVFTAPNRYALLGANQTPEISEQGESLALHEALLNEKYKQDARRELYGTPRPIENVGVLGTLKNVYRSIVAERRKGFGKHTNVNAFADGIDAASKLAPEVQKEWRMRHYTSMIGNGVLGAPARPGVPTDALRKKNERSILQITPNILLPFVDHDQLRDPGTIVRMGGVAATAAGLNYLARKGIASKSIPSLTKHIKPMSAQVGRLLRIKSPGAVATGTLLASLLGTVAYKLPARKEGQP